MNNIDTDLTLIFPTQLFYDIKYIKTKNIYLIEEQIYFTNYNYHKMKLAYHRATMKYYYDYLKKKLKNHNIKYIDFHKIDNKFYEDIKNKNIYINNPIEHQLTDKLKKIFKNRLTILQTPNFLLNDIEIDYIKNNIFKKSYNHRLFYIYQRKKLNILINEKLEPYGNKWSFDDENRKKLPNKINIPSIPKIINNKYTKEAIKYINKYFNNNYGEINFIYPINYKNSLIWLDNFLQHKLFNFGLYEDAVTEKDVFIFHSVLSPMMNIGLLTDKIVIDHTMKFYNLNKKKINIQNIEGFIRQIIGWRNFIYSIYMIEKPIINTKLSTSDKLDKFWTGNTNMYPIDSIIKNKIIPYAYCHHIERLMYLGNFLKLCMMKDAEIYKLFMEWTIDAYNWVMWGNVYGMVLNQIKIMKKNYIASSNYILKMSDFKNNNDNNWCKIFNCLYYNYISENIDILKKDYGLAFQISIWKKKTPNEKKEIHKIATNFIKSL